MDVKESYNLWASHYDTNENRTRDLEALALRQTLSPMSFKRCLEIGCGTGKNTEWLVENSDHVTAVDLSDRMLSKAKEKVTRDNVDFIQADIISKWKFQKNFYDLIVFSLVLEHIEMLDPVFIEATSVLSSGGYLFVGELHPFKQYKGSKARFDTREGHHVVPCFNHHISDFIHAGKKSGLTLVELEEFFDAERNDIPRILTSLFRKN
jgi:ubiquinone/menaquinone biosynthesis C-methylase UbiE